MTQQQAIEALRECPEKGIKEGHQAADKILCTLLRSLGYDDVIDEYEILEKWYS